MYLQPKITVASSRMNPWYNVLIGIYVITDTVTEDGGTHATIRIFQQGKRNLEYIVFTITRTY